MPPGVTAGAGNLRFVGTVFPAVTSCAGFADCEGTLGVDACADIIVHASRVKTARTAPTA